MSWSVVGGAAIGTVGSYLSGRSAASGAERAAETSAEAQMAGLDYLKESERLPMHYRDQALAALAAEYGLAPPVETNADGREIVGYEEIRTPNPDYQPRMRALDAVSSVAQGVNSADEFLTEERPIYGDVVTEGGLPSTVDRAMASPLYQALLSQRSSGEESILRNAAATGRLRGGATIESLADYNTNLENQALLTSYQNIMGGLSSLSGAQGYAPQIANQYTNIGQTLGAGQAGASRAMQEAYGGVAQGIGQGFKAYLNRPTV